MGLKKKALIGLMAVSLAGCVVGGALALTRNGATGNGVAPAFDEAVYLYWDAGVATSATLTDIPNISVGTPVYRKLVVSPQSTKSVAGYVDLTFTMAAADGKVATGLSVAIYDTGSTSVDLSDDDAITTYCVAGNLRQTLDASAPKTVSFEVEPSNNAVHTTANNYVLKVVYAGGVGPGQQLGATVSIAQSFRTA